MDQKGTALKLQTHQILGEDECARAHALVLEMRRFWTPRHETIPSFTLGAASYLDVPRSGVTEYYRGAVRGNILLRRRFDWLYLRLASSLRAVLDGPVGFTGRYALPGFHIYVGDERLKELVPTLHFDLQDRDLDWDDEAVRGNDACVSFTVPIAIPKCGAGLDVWDIRYGDTSDLDEAAVLALVRSLPRHHHAYRLGEMLVHGGDRLHRIANDRLPGEGESRVTLQGHGRLTHGSWELYW